MCLQVAKGSIGGPSSEKGDHGGRKSLSKALKATTKVQEVNTKMSLEF